MAGLEGRELDEEVAVLLGWVQYPDGWQYTADGRRWRKECPPYSTDYALLPELEAWCRDAGLNLTHTDGDDGVMVEMWRDGRMISRCSTGTTYPEALSRAIVAAAGGG